MSPLEKIINSLEAALEKENWYGALIIGLTLPDICSKIVSPQISTNKRYPQWFTDFMDTNYRSHLSWRDCYALRCAFLHEWNSITERQSIKEVVDKFYFIWDGSHLNSFRNIHAKSIDDGKNVCVLSVKHFCKDIQKWVERWLEKYKDNERIRAWLEEILNINEDWFSLYWWAIRIG